MKLFSFRERTRFEIRGDFLNGLNHPQYTQAPSTTSTTSAVPVSPTTNPGNALFGQFDQVYSNNPRSIQVGAKVTF